MDRYTATDMVASKHTSQTILPTLQPAEPIPPAPLLLPESSGFPAYSLLGVEVNPDYA